MLAYMICPLSRECSICSRTIILDIEGVILATVHCTVPLDTRLPDRFSHGLGLQTCEGATLALLPHLCPLIALPNITLHDSDLEALKPCGLVSEIP